MNESIIINKYFFDINNNLIIKMIKRNSIKLTGSISDKSCNALLLNTKSRSSIQSPEILPSAHAACSITSGSGDFNNLENIGITP